MNKEWNMKERAAFRIAGNWRLWKRLPRIAKMAKAMGLVTAETTREKNTIESFCKK